MTSLPAGFTCEYVAEWGLALAKPPLSATNGGGWSVGLKCLDSRAGLGLIGGITKAFKLTDQFLN